MTAISAASATDSIRHETADPFRDLPSIRGPDDSLHLTNPIGASIGHSKACIGSLQV